jgi:HK97 gp10 family phage protein
MALPAFLQTEPRHPQTPKQKEQGQLGQRMSQSQALGYLQKVPLATSRNKANAWQLTGVADHRHRALDDMAQPRKGEDGNFVFTALRTVESTKDGLRLYDRSAESHLTARGRFELKNAVKRKSLSLGQSAKADGSLYDRQSIHLPAGSEGQVGGNLRRSVRFSEEGTGDEPQVSIVAGGKDAPYARFVEFGTRHAAAQPFLRPALKHVEEPYRQMMRTELLGNQ